MDDENNQNAPAAEPVAPAPEPVIETTPVAPVEDQSTPVAEESPTEPVTSPTIEPVQSVSAQPAPAPVFAPVPLTSLAPQPQSPAQQDQTGFIRALLAKANAKLHSNRQKKLDKLMLLAQKKGSITNEDTQDLLHCSDATATRYLVRLVQQGRLTKTDGSHWVKYRFVR